MARICSTRSKILLCCRTAQPFNRPTILSAGAKAGAARPKSILTPPIPTTTSSGRSVAKPASLLPPLQPGPVEITLRLQAAGPNQTLSLSLNGVHSPAQPLPESWSDLRFTLPAGAIRSQVNDLRLHFGRTYPVTQPATASPLNLLVESAGLEAGLYGHIWLNGQEISPNRRGYNLALIDPASGRLLAAANFDTHGDPQASAALLDFLAQRPAGSLLAVAVKDTAGDQLSPEAAAALTRLGLSDLRGRFRWSQAAIIPDGQPALEAISATGPVSVGWGAGWREQRVAAAVAEVRIISAR